MKKLILSCLFAMHTIFFAACVAAVEPEIVFPKISKTAAIDDEYKNMQWNRYTTKNFTIISINNKDGEWLYKNLDKIKSDCLKKWGITSSEFSAECRLMVVNDKNLFKKFFNLTENRIEVRKKDGKTEIIGVWICLEEKELNELTKIISQICFEDMLDKKNSNKKFLEEGVSTLSSSKQKIKNLIKDATPDISIIEIDQEKYKKLTEKEKENFTANSVIICLMLKKEFGEKNFLKLMFSKGDSLEQIKKIYKFNDKEELEKTFKRYCGDLKKSIEKNELKDTYLNIER